MTTTSKPRSRLPGKKELASRVASSLGLCGIVGKLRPHVRRDLRVLAYHRVLPQVTETGYAFDKDLVSASREEFEWQVRHIARHYRPVSCSEVAEAIESGKPLPRNAVMLTFDDGFIDNYEVAFPILRKHGVPGVFFISTGYIDSGDVFWFDHLVHVILKAQAPSIRLDAIGQTLELGTDEDGRRHAAARLLGLLKRSPESARLQALSELAAAAGVSLSDDEKAGSAPMTWAQIREMSNAGMEFGSHTVSHPILSTIADDAQLQHELCESKAAIERELGRPVVALAYPVGGRDAINGDVLAATEKAGYRVAFTYQPGTEIPRQASRFSLPRIHVERYTTRARFKASLVLPELFAS